MKLKMIWKKNKLVIILLIIAVLLIFFYPKRTNLYCGDLCGEYWGCKYCFGFKYTETRPNWSAEYCAGLPIGCLSTPMVT